MTQYAGKRPGKGADELCSTSKSKKEVATMDKITLAHGAGGEKSRELMEKIILPAFDNPILREMHDGARLSVGGQIAFTTDSYVVHPRFFPGGNIGKLAVCGTVNDLAVTGAIPRYISAGGVLEEGFDAEELKKIAETMRRAADEAGVLIVTGDTKVVERGKCDGIFINTAGIGEIIPGANISPKNVKPGMSVILSGCIGDHAATVMAARHGLDAEGIQSDCAPLNKAVQNLLAAFPDTAMLRDPTRGGVAAVLNETAVAAEVGIIIDEEKIPLREETKSVCDILGFDVLQLANEGKFIAFLPKEKAEEALRFLRKQKYAENACIIGETTEKSPGVVALRTPIGGLRVVDMPLGEIVPRIC